MRGFNPSKAAAATGVTVAQLESGYRRCAKELQRLADTAATRGGYFNGMSVAMLRDRAADQALRAEACRDWLVSNIK